MLFQNLISITHLSSFTFSLLIKGVRWYEKPHNSITAINNIILMLF